MHSLVLDTWDFFQALIHIHTDTLQGLPVRKTAPPLPCSLGCILEAWGAPSHRLKLWAGSVVRLTLELPPSVLWDLQPEDFFFLYFLLFPVIGQKLRGRFLLFLLLWGTAASSDATGHKCSPVPGLGMAAACVPFSQALETFLFYLFFGSFWVFFYALPGLPSSPQSLGSVYPVTNTHLWWMSTWAHI